MIYFIPKVKASKCSLVFSLVIPYSNSPFTAVITSNPQLAYEVHVIIFIRKLQDNCNIEFLAC